MSLCIKLRYEIVPKVHLDLADVGGLVERQSGRAIRATVVGKHN